MEETNARYVERLPEAVDLVVIDASFISLKTAAAGTWLVGSSTVGTFVALIKPQFEAGRAISGARRRSDPRPGVHRQVLSDVLGFAIQHGFKPARPAALAAARTEGQRRVPGLADSPG